MDMVAKKKRFYLIGICSTDKDGVVSCFPYATDDDVTIADLKDEINTKLDTFEYKCRIAEINLINIWTFMELCDMDIVNAVISCRKRDGNSKSA